MCIILLDNYGRNDKFDIPLLKKHSIKLHLKKKKMNL